jgi:hypothetical protein
MRPVWRLSEDCQMKEALKLALEALETELAVDMTNGAEVGEAAELMCEAITAIKQALAAPIQKPVATYKGPEELWLQLHGDCSDDELTEPVDYTDSSVTWCWHQIHDSDVRYVRADTIPPAAPVQEPVGALILGGVIDTSDGPEYEEWDVEWNTKAVEALQEKLVTSNGVTLMLYTTPHAAQRQWVGLTDEERQECTQSPFTAENYRAIEAKLKERNNG